MYNERYVTNYSPTKIADSLAIYIGNINSVWRIYVICKLPVCGVHVQFVNNQCVAYMCNL